MISRGLTDSETLVLKKLLRDDARNWLFIRAEGSSLSPDDHLKAIRGGETLEESVVFEGSFIEVVNRIANRQKERDFLAEAELLKATLSERVAELEKQLALKNLAIKQLEEKCRQLEDELNEPIESLWGVKRWGDNGYGPSYNDSFEGLRAEMEVNALLRLLSKLPIPKGVLVVDKNGKPACHPKNAVKFLKKFLYWFDAEYRKTMKNFNVKTGYVSGYEDLDNLKQAKAAPEDAGTPIVKNQKVIYERGDRFGTRHQTQTKVVVPAYQGIP